MVPQRQTRTVKLDFHPAMGERWEIARSTEETSGEVFESTVWFDPRMPEAPPHLHPNGEESFEVIEGSFDVFKDGQWTTVRPGATATASLSEHVSARALGAPAPRHRRVPSTRRAPSGVPSSLQPALSSDVT